MLAFCAVVAIAIIGAEAQSGTHGHGNTNLHSICHSNHQQLTEDQVIERVVNDMDYNKDDNITQAEMLLFFANLMGASLQEAGMTVDQLLALDNDLLLQLAAGLEISKTDFVHNWHNKYHDSVAFVSATFDALEAMNPDADGALDADEIEAIGQHANANFDSNGDGTLQRAELVAYFEHIYKNC